MEIIKLESLDKLKRFVKEDAEYSFVASASLQDIVEELSLETIELDIPAFDNSDYALDGSLVDLSNVVASDVTLSPQFYKQFDTLSPALATDERLWTALALGRFSDYTKVRYTKNHTDETKARNWILAHWLCGSGARDKFRDNAISRLWWMGRVSHSIPGWPPEKVAEQMISDSDYRQNLMDRTTSSNALNVSKAILQISHRMKEDDKKLSREQFRAVMKEITFVAGRTNLAVLSDDHVLEILNPIFDKVLELPKKVGLMKRLLSRG